MAAKKQKKQKNVKWMRNYIFMVLIILIFGIISYFSLNTYKYEAARYIPEVESITGYQVDGTTYTVTDENEHMIVFTGLPENSRGLYLYFNQAPGVDTAINAALYEGENQKKVIDSTIAATDAYAALLYPETDIDHLVVSIDGTFDLATAQIEGLYEADNGMNEALRNKCIILVIILLLLLVAPAGFSRVDQWMDALIQKAGAVLDFWCLGKTWKEAGICLLSIVAGNVLWIPVRNVFMAVKWSLSSHNILFGCMVGVILYVLLYYFRSDHMSFEKLYLYCGIVISIVLAILLPMHLNVSWDDQIHYNYATCLSHLNRADISLSEETYYQSCFYNQLKGYGQNNHTELANVLNDTALNQTRINSDIGTMPLYKAIVYFPVAVMIFVARGIGIPTTAYIVLGKIAGALFYFSVIYLGMRHLKSGKLVLAASSMVPIAIFLVGNYNYDYWVVALINYSMARLVGEYQRPENPITVKSLLIIVLTFLVACVAKPVYLPLLGLLAFLPGTKFKNKRIWMGYIGFFAVLVLCMVLGLCILVFGGGLGTGDIRGGTEVNVGQQIQYILARPKEFFNTLMGFMKEYLSLTNIKIDLIDTAYIPRKDWLGGFVLLWLILVGFLDRNKEENKKIHWGLKVCVVPLAFICACACATALYITFTAVGSNTVAGCQGRYLLPILFPLMIILSRIRFLIIPIRGKGQKILNVVTMFGTIVIAGIMISYFV